MIRSILLMGQSNSNSLARHNYLTQFTLEARNPDHNLTFLAHKQTQQQYLLREVIHNDPLEFSRALGVLKDRLGFAHPSITRLIKLEQEEVENICSKIFKVYMLWEYGPTTLADEINCRGLERRPFSHRHIANLLRSTAEALLYYSGHGLAFECLTTKAIIVSDLSFKVIDPLMLSLPNNLDCVFNNRNVKNIYLSPEQCKLIELEIISLGTQEADQVFTAALIVLEAATLERKNECYLEKCSRVNWEAINTNLNRFEGKYGKELRGILGRMLHPDPKQRLSFRQLCKQVEQAATNCEKQEERAESLKIKCSSSLRGSFERLSKTEINSSASNMYNTQKMTAAQYFYPERLVETLYVSEKLTKPREEPFIYQKPPTLLEMKTINTITQMSPSDPPLAFDNELSTAKTSQPFRGLDSFAFPPNPCSSFSHKLSASPNQSQDSELENAIKMKKYEHAEPKTALHKFFVEQFKLGSRYEGYKLNGKREGWGKFYFQEGGLYQGEWRENKMHGYGKLHYQSGKLAYEGNWVMDEFEGVGKLFNETYTELAQPYDFNNLADLEEYWVFYEGEFKNDAKCGRGALKLSNGEIFEGSFTEDEITGQGIYFTSNGRKVRGFWRRGKLQSISQPTHPLNF